jgi:4'-phosphopantetheinyl transferase
LISIKYSRLNNELDPEKLQYYIHSLPENMRPAVRRYRRWQDMQLSLFGKLLLVRGLAGCIADREWQDKFCLSPFQRPVLADSSVDFNISHAGDVVACAIGYGCRVGIDIEQIKKIDIEDFRTQFRLDEWEDILHAEDRSEAFFQYWTRKEAVAKLSGEGLNLPLQQIVFDQNKAYYNGKTSYLRSVNVHEGYSCHLAADQDNCAVTGIKEILF